MILRSLEGLGDRCLIMTVNCAILSLKCIVIDHAHLREIHAERIHVHAIEKAREALGESSQAFVHQLQLHEVLL